VRHFGTNIFGKKLGDPIKSMISSVPGWMKAVIIADLLKED